jgi:hypothetical protein
MSTTDSDNPLPSRFADGIANIGFSGGVVRIDFAELSAVARDEHGQATLERTLRVVMTLEGFLAAHQTMQQLVEQLAAKGKLAIAPRLRAKPGQDG